MKELRVGIIGLGMGRAHVKSFQAHPHAKVVAIADLDEERLKTMGDKWGISSLYANAEEMIAKESLDIVGVATPNKWHKPLTIAALEAGCHVFCEKPMALNASEARDMLDAARKAGRRLMINFSFRFIPTSWAIKQEVDSGALGDIYFARSVWLRRWGMPKFGGWFGQKALSGGGPLIDLGVHRLDLALWFMGYPKPVWTMAGAHNRLASSAARESGKRFDVEDLAVALIKFENGALLELEASWAGHIKEKELIETRLLGEKGGAVQRNLDEGYQFEAEFFTTRNECRFDAKLHAPFPRVPDACEHFADCIVADKPHSATGEEGLIVMQILDAIYESAETGELVKMA